MRLKNALLAAIGAVLIIGVGVTLVSVLGATSTSLQAARRITSDTAVADSISAVVGSPVKLTDPSGPAAKRSEPGGLESATRHPLHGNSTRSENEGRRPATTTDAGIGAPGIR